MKKILTADKIITEKQVKYLLKEIQREKELAASNGKNFKFITDYFLIAITYNTGLRISEVADLKWSDIFDDYLIVRNGKGGKSRTVFFGCKTKAMFDEYEQLLLKHQKAAEYVFTGQRGPLKRCAIHLRFKYWIKRVGLPEHLSFHGLRHGYGSRMLDNGLPLSSVRDLLGHSNIAITSVYLHFTEKSKDKIKKLL